MTKQGESVETRRLYPGGLARVRDLAFLGPIWALDGPCSVNWVKNDLFLVTDLRFIGIGGPIRISSTLSLFDSRFKT